MKIKTETTSDLVWARMKYCPYWPARLVTAPPSLGTTPRNKLCVLFFGSKEFGFVDTDKVVNYPSNKSQFIAKGKGWGTAFANAVKQIDEYMSDPVKHKSNASVKARDVVVKTEQNVELRLGIKRERGSTHNVAEKNNSRSTDEQPPNFSWAEEKQRLIDEIILLKAASQRYTLDLKKTEEKLKNTVARNQQIELSLKQNNETHFKKVNELQTELNKINASHEKLKVDNAKHVLELTRDRDLLRAQAKQLQTAISQQVKTIKKNDHVNSSESEEEEYEVECLLKDKLIQKRAYLVRWKNYDSSHDSWVEEANLNCPSILKKYKQSKRK